MADKKIVLAFAFMFFALSHVFAQNYYIDRSGEDLRIIQKIEWQDSEYASRYIVIIEMLNEETNQYSEIDRVDTLESYAEFSLGAGSYRYKIEVYDLLDKYAFTTDYHNMEIIPAYLPALTTFSPQAFFLDEDYNWTITLRGENFFPETEIYLLENNKDPEEAVKIYPVTYTPDGDTAHLEFAISSLVPGDYGIYIVNPGGLDTLVQTFRIAFMKKVDFNVSLGYSPVVPLYGHMFTDERDYQAPFPGGIYLLSGGLRASILPFKRYWGFLGFEFTGSLSLLDNETEHYSTQAFFLNTHLALQFQKYFFRRNLVFNLALGGGITNLMDFHYEFVRGITSESITVSYPSLIAGTSLMIFIKKPFYIQPGIDFIHIFSEDSPQSGFIRPYLNLGIRF